MSLFRTPGGQHLNRAGSETLLNQKGRLCFLAVLQGLQLGTTLPLVVLPPRMMGTR